MTTVDAVARQGRASFARGAWSDAYDRLAAAHRTASLGAEDLERLAVAAHLTGRESECVASWTRAHHAFLRTGDVERAARCAFWLAFALLEAGEQARASGWLARAGRLLDDGRDCVERGYLLLPDAMRHIVAGDYVSADAVYERAAAIGARFGDADLVALARHGQGRVRIRMGALGDGVRLLDEAMAAVDAGELSPLVAGDVYCSVIAGCMEIQDLRRAQEWTLALARWCDAQPDLVPYRGQCLVRRAELLQLSGAWPEAMDAARQACGRGTARVGRSAAGAAFYQLGELHRLRGEITEAEEAYREASRCGRRPQPGLARLRLLQGRTDVAAIAIRRALDETAARRSRLPLLAPCVEILLAAGDRPGARAAADELSAIAAELDQPLVRATAAQAQGAVLLAEGDAAAALDALRRSWTAWQELDAPYEAARVRVLVALACRALGDEDAAGMELDAARCALGQLGAAPEVARIERLSRARGSAPAHGLTARERQVLRLLAAGATNRGIAERLAISEKTVARHVSNIFVKLDLSNRSAAAAWACRNGLG